MKAQLLGVEYEDMPQEYRDKISKEIFEARQAGQRMAGDKVIELGLDPYKQAEYNVKNLDNFDFASFGAGGAVGRGSSGFDNDDREDDVYGKGRGRFSRQDAKGLYRAGNLTAQELYDYGEANDGIGDFIFGGKTKQFLQRKINKDNNGGGGDRGPQGPGGGGSGNQTINVGTGGGGGDTGGGGSRNNVSFNTNQQNDNRITFGNVGGSNNTVNPIVNNSVNNNFTDNSDNSTTYGGSMRFFNYGDTDIPNIFDVDPASPTPNAIAGKGFDTQALLANYIRNMGMKSVI